MYVNTYIVYRYPFFIETVATPHSITLILTLAYYVQTEFLKEGGFIFVIGYQEQIRRILLLFNFIFFLVYYYAVCAQFDVFVMALYRSHFTSVREKKSDPIKIASFKLN